MPNCTIHISGKQVCSQPAAVDEARRLRAEGGLIVPSEKWLTRANTFTSPLGPAPGRGWILMRREDITTAFKEDLHELVFIQDTTEIRLQSLRFAGAVNVFPVAPTDKNSLMLVELVDPRYKAQMSAINKQYNVLRWDNAGQDDGDERYYAWSMPSNGGTTVPWTWEEMIEDIWDKMSQLGDFPGLPYEPSGTPMNWRFVGVSAYAALNSALAAISCALAFDPTDNTFAIYRRGDISQLDNTHNFDNSRGELLYFSEFEDNDDLDLPNQIAVFFNRKAADDYTTESIASDVRPLTPVDMWEQYPAMSHGRSIGNGLTEAGSDGGLALWSDMWSVIHHQTQPGATLQTKSLEVANNWIMAVRYGGRPMHRIYAGPISFFCGPDVTAIRWSWRANELGEDHGMLTEVIRTPELLTDAAEFPELGDLPLTMSWPTAIETLMPPDLARNRPMPNLFFEGYLIEELEPNGEADASLTIGGTAMVTFKDTIGLESPLTVDTKIEGRFDHYDGKYRLRSFACGG